MLKVQKLGSQKISNMLKIISIHMTNLLLLSPSKTIFWNLVHFSQYLTSKPCWKDLFSSLKFPVFTPFRSFLLYLPQCLIYYQYSFPKYGVSYMIYCNLSLKKLGFILPVFITTGETCLLSVNCKSDDILYLSL